MKKETTHTEASEGAISTPAQHTPGPRRHRQGDTAMNPHPFTAAVAAELIVVLAIFLGAAVLVNLGSFIP